MKYRFQINLETKLDDINPIHIGEATLPPGHTWGPSSINYVMIHKIVSGHGTLFSRGRTYRPKAGDAFILMPGEIAKWVADTEDPWHYQWVSFTGKLSNDFGQLEPVFQPPENTLLHFKVDADNAPPNLGHLLAGDLMHLYAMMLVAEKVQPDHVLRAINYIQLHHAEDLTIQTISDHVGLNRDYFARLFKQKTGMTLQAHIMAVRVHTAQQLMYDGYSVKESALLSGFKDPSNFSKYYKRINGVSPKQWKKEIRNPSSGRRTYEKN